MNDITELENQFNLINNIVQEYNKQLAQFKKNLDGSLPAEAIELQKNINELERTRQELQQLLEIFNKSFEE